jgi:hypothetical protein
MAVIVLTFHDPFSMTTAELRLRFFVLAISLPSSLPDKFELRDVI